MIVVKASDKHKKAGKMIFFAGSIEMGKTEHWQTRLTKDFKNVDYTILNSQRDDRDSLDKLKF